MSQTPNSPSMPLVQPVTTGYSPELEQFLLSYNGTFSFILDIRSKFLKYKRLSDKQWDGVRKCMVQQQKNNAGPITTAIKCSIPIVVSATAARVIAKMHGWSFNPCTFVLTSIVSYDRKGYTVKGKIDWTGNATSCRCCQKDLTDWRSQATGVGPVCVKRLSISYVKDKNDIARFQKEMEDLCAKLGEVEFYIKKWSMDDNYRKAIDKTIALIANSASTQAITTPAPTPVVAYTPPYISESVNIRYANCDWDDSFRRLTVKHKMSCYKTIYVLNEKTGNKVQFDYAHHAEGDSRRFYWSVDFEGQPISLVVNC